MNELDEMKKRTELFCPKSKQDKKLRLEIEEGN
jgi:hypothetical protein